MHEHLLMAVDHLSCERLSEKVGHLLAGGNII